MNEKILLVDDEKQILQALQRTLYGQGYNIFTASNGKNALEIMEKEKINLLITDIRMPEMNGYELLKHVKEKYPSTIRVVLSGYAKSSLIVQIQRKSLAKRYINKPWKNQELIEIIRQIFKVEKRLQDKNLLELINKIDYLPSPNNVYYKFNNLVKEDANIEEIAKFIETDQSVAAKVLQVANSAMYGLNTGSLKQAITYLGLENVRYIVLSVTTFNNTKETNNSILNRDINMLWKHATSTNQIFNHLHKSILGKKTPDPYTSLGLLHDIGKIVLMTNFTTKYMKAAESIYNKKDLVYYYEDMEFISVTSNEIGAYLLNWWELPGLLVETVLYQDSPLASHLINKEIIQLLSISGAHSWNHIFSGNYVPINQQILENLNLSQKDLDTMLSEIKIDLYI